MTLLASLCSILDAMKLTLLLLKKLPMMKCKKLCESEFQKYKKYFSSEWYADYNTDDIINLMMAAEGHFGNSMARRQVLYLQIDAAVLVKFNDQIVTIMNRLRFNGKSKSELTLK